MIKTEADLQSVKKSGGILAEALKTVARATKVGVTTLELDALAEKTIRDLGGEPAFIGYQGYKHSLCTSLNDQVVHTPPSADVMVMEGDVISLDLGVRYEGWNTDMALTMFVGQATEEAKKLVRVTREALVRAIAEAQPGNHIGDISRAIQHHVEAAGLSVVRTLFGHGVGRELHEAPQIPNFGTAGSGEQIVPGMVLAIEPITTAGSPETITEPDRWTIRTVDRSLAAHFEHTVLITNSGPEILTLVE